MNQLDPPHLALHEDGCKDEYLLQLSPARCGAVLRTQTKAANIPHISPPHMWKRSFTSLAKVLRLVVPALR